MLDSISHTEGNYRVSKKAAFDYYKDFEKYPQRYPDHCEKVEIINRSENIITTREFWNVGLSTDVYHVVMSIRYELIPHSEIRYEIIDGHKTGIKNTIKFSDVENYLNYKCSIELALPILDITGHPNASKSSVYQDLVMYIGTKDLQHLEGAKIGFSLGETCSECKTGKLGTRLGGGTEVGNHKLTDEQFECDSCHRVFKNYLSISTETV